MNWKQEAKEKLRRYNAMRLATINIPQELERLEIDARSIRSAKTDGTPVAGGGNKREEAVIVDRAQSKHHILDGKISLANEAMLVCSIHFGKLI